MSAQYALESVFAMRRSISSRKVATQKGNLGSFQELLKTNDPNQTVQELGRRFWNTVQLSLAAIVFADVSKFYGEVLGVNRIDLELASGITAPPGDADGKRFGAGDVAEHLLDRVDAHMHGVHEARQLPRNGCLSCPRQAAEHDQHGSSLRPFRARPRVTTSP